MNAGYTRVVTNAGSLQVGDVVFEHKERILKIYEQSESVCLCKLVMANGAAITRNHEVNTVNALVLVTAGPTLDAANAKGDLNTTPTGQPIWKRESEEEKEDSKYQKANAPRIETQFVRFNPFDAGNEYAERTDVERAIAFHVDFTAMLNNGWRVTCEMFDGQIFTARLEREVRK